MPGSPDLFQPLEDTIRMVFIPALLRREVNDLERDLLSLPAGMGIVKPTEECHPTRRTFLRSSLQREFPSGLQ